MAAPSPKKLGNVGIAANLFDRVRKTSPTSPAPPSPAATSSNGPTFASSLLNKAISFHKSLNKPEKSSNQVTNLLIIDDEDFDDPSAPPTPPKSDLLLNVHDGPLPVSSKSDFDISKRAQENSVSTGKLTASSSLYKLGSQVLDDLVARNNPTLNSVVDEADALRRRFLTKKKSIESSLDSLTKKNKVNPMVAPSSTEPSSEPLMSTVFVETSSCLNPHPETDISNEKTTAINCLNQEKIQVSIADNTNIGQIVQEQIKVEALPEVIFYFSKEYNLF